MKYKHIFIILLGLLLTLPIQAQRKGRRATPDTTQVVKDYVDSLRVLRHQLDSLEQLNNQLRQESTDGRYFRLFAPTTFYHSGPYKSWSLYPQHDDDVADAVDAAMMQIYLKRPDLVRNNESRLRRVGSIREDVNTDIVPQVELTDIVVNPDNDLPARAGALGGAEAQVLEVQR